MQKGPDDRAVVELLTERGIPCIAGNHDRAARSKLALDDEVSNYLRELPPTLTFTLEDKRVLMTHARRGVIWSTFFPRQKSMYSSVSPTK